MRSMPTSWATPPRAASCSVRVSSPNTGRVSFLWGAKTRTPHGAGFLGSSGNPAVLADQSADGRPSADSCRHVDHLAGLIQRRAKRSASMRTVIVIVLLVFGQHVPEVSFTVDQ